MLKIFFFFFNPGISFILVCLIIVYKQTIVYGEQRMQVLYNNAEWKDLGMFSKLLKC